MSALPHPKDAPTLIVTPFQDGIAAYQRGDYATAVELWRPLAEEGDASAQCGLGFMYAMGQGVRQDDTAALGWYRKAADQGNASAQTNLGVFCERGRGGLSKDDAAAANWYRKAAEQRDALAEFNLGVFYEQGRGGLPTDDRAAASWYRKAADQGYASSQHNLGKLYEQGRGGLPNDDTAAASWYRKAADQGETSAQNSLGAFYEHGRGGLPKDKGEAARLYKLAADQGHAAAQYNLARFHEQRRGGLEDEREGSRLYELATDHGNATAQNNLGTLYSQGPAGLGAHILAFLYNNTDDERTIFNNLKKWASCPHGVLAGKYKNRCGKCVRERNEIEEDRRRRQEIWERQRRIDAAADSLRKSELQRLAKSLIPCIQELRLLSPQRFEDEVAQMFERLGYQVKQTPYTKDGGRDAILTKHGKTYLVECKRYAEGGLSGRRDLQILHSAMMTDGAISGFFVTAGRFTQDAIKFAATVPIELIDQDALVRMMFDSKPAADDDDAYCSMCRQCEDVVSHRLRAPQSVTCRNRHDVEPSLDIKSVLVASAKRTHFYIG